MTIENNNLLEKIEAELSNYPTLSNLLNTDNRLKRNWLRALNRNPEGVLYFTDDKQFLSILSMVANMMFDIEHDASFGFLIKDHEILSRLEKSLSKLQAQENFVSFAKKIRNPDGIHLISTISELFFAEHLFDKGCTIAFEPKIEFYSEDLSKTIQVDIDFAVRNQEIEFYVEVYNPVELSPIGVTIMDTLDSSDFITRIKNKIQNKFKLLQGFSPTQDDIPIVLAVNTAYHDKTYRKVKRATTRNLLMEALTTLHIENNPVSEIIVYSAHGRQEIEFVGLSTTSLSSNSKLRPLLLSTH